ncbi:3-oxoacyl carrier protein synthase [Tieghemostelium lacteum]|uniref:beta-ketoacyl-[acyl-carrier-protein] synthase I n=1 Tax=Tieghemostelium lacteum TaxID=361077 RepID=A0A151ZDZ0_TIELA|nr:3-oxoacyl carrier protein synthase [Tieghemostelium lacteum]|eukprot:KYQ92161.1 3-oxoacyl carrier protein synthase [Tieghemostelium lacteum]
MKKSKCHLSSNPTHAQMIKFYSKTNVKILYNTYRYYSNQTSRGNNLIQKRRVVVSGMGLVTPLGIGIENNWKSLLSGQSGIKDIDFKDFPIKLPVKVAGQVDKEQFQLSASKDVPIEYKLASSDFIKYAIVAAQEAISDSSLNFKEMDTSKQERYGVYIGSGIGAFDDITLTNSRLNQQPSLSKVSAYFIPRILINEVSGIISMIHQLKGPNLSLSTACATGAHAIGESMRKIQYGDSDIMVCGGTEACLNPLAVLGFHRMNALSTKSNQSKPFDKDRDGFVMGEGAGILVLEELEHALNRNAKIYCEITGYGATGDAFHISSPDKEGKGALRSMQLALKEANIQSPLEIDYINAHATSTPLGDQIEQNTVVKLYESFGVTNQNHKITMTSNKGNMGHLLGAAGSVESIYSILSLWNNLIPPTLNLNEPSPNLNINLVQNQPLQKTISHVLKNSYGFGGTNASLVFSKYIS